MINFLEFINKDITAKKTMITSMPVKTKTNIKKYNKTLDEIQSNMYKKALDTLEKRIIKCTTKKEIEDTLSNKLGFAKFMYEDTSEEENYLKEKFNATPRVIPFDELPFDEFDPITKKKADKVIYYSRAY